MAELFTIHRDIESGSLADLGKVGADVYAANVDTFIWCMAFAVNDGPVQVWMPGMLVPPEFVEAEHNPNWWASAHNDLFETAMERHILGPRHGFPLIPIERHRCTMAAALALGLPAKLSRVADALELTNRKDTAGERLMHQMSKPRKPRKGEDPAGGPYWFDDEERRQRLCHVYCPQDVEIERELSGYIPALSESEQALWVLSCLINQRGFHVDKAFIRAARKVAEAAEPEINSEIAQITNNAVPALTQLPKMKAWLHAQGCAVTSLDHDMIEKLLADEELLLPSVARVLRLRLDGAQSATGKIDALLAHAGEGDRVRGEFQFHGASTGRWSGKGVQPQNMKRPVVEDLDAAITAVATGDYAHVKSLYPQPLAIIGDCSRPTITAAPGFKLIGGDYGAIESRVLAHVAGEEWKLDAYRRYAATGDATDEPYTQTAARILRTSAALITKEQRRVGKTCDLAFGYQGGIPAFRKFMPDGFTDDQIEQFKRDWRNEHRAIKKFWYAIDAAAVLAVRERGQIVKCDPVSLKCAGLFLRIKLPSGRKLSYPQPRIIEDRRGEHVVYGDNADGQFKDCRNGRGAYGGVWTENIVSGIARDLLCGAMQRAEAAGYPIVLHVHDSLAAEVPEGFGSCEEFTRLMTIKPAWALNLPIAATAWMGQRFVG